MRCAFPRYGFSSGHVKLHILPDRVTVEVVDGLHFLIEIHICGEGHVGVVGRLEVGHAAGGNAETPQHCRQRRTETGALKKNEFLRGRLID